MLSRPAAGLLVSLLLLSTLFSVIPIAPVHGSSGVPSIGVLDSRTAPTTFTAASSFVAVVAGTDTASADNTTAGFFAIQFSGVTFSGSQFYLYLSKDGFSDISATDVKYAGIFNVANLGGTYGVLPVQANGTFYAGLVGGVKTLEGPLPTQISSDYKYVKVFDGSTTAVAVTAQHVNVQPGLTLTPTSGPAGTPVTVSAGGFPSDRLIDLTYSYVYYPWSGSSTTRRGNWTTGVNTGSGSFNSTFPMLDSKQGYNPNSGVQAVSHIDILAKYQASPHSLLASAAFDEKTRVLTGVISRNSGGGVIDRNNLPPGPYGNDTSAAGSNLLQPVDANVLGTLNIAGDDSMVNSTVTFLFGTTLAGSYVTDGTGHFNATIIVPMLPAGTSQLSVINDGVTYVFAVFILPTLTLMPSSGTVGTEVTVHAYGFPANTQWFLYWHEHSFGDSTWYQVAHGETGATGAFNVPVSFVVPQSYGGTHAVSASTTNASTSSPNAPGTTEALASFAISSTSGSSSTVTVTTTEPTTLTQPTTQTATVTQSSTITRTSILPTTVTQPTTMTETSVQTTTAAGPSSISLSTYAELAALTIVVSALAALAAWMLRGRRP
jgi:hypothetical protein